jgi:NAD(P)-dependent dehydrogenase (short-subunit alcohol dehydrogenase family)
LDLGVRGKAYAIVGGTTGMGFATARVLAEDGAMVALIGRDPARGAARADELVQATGADVRMFAGDARDAASIQGAVEAVVQAFGRLNGLAVTAGPTASQATFADLTDADWSEYFELQLMSVVRANRAALPHIVAAGGGAVVNVAAYSIRAQKPTLAAYTAMKTAVASITKNIAVNYGKHGVRANTVCPGFIFTESANRVATMAAEKYGLPPYEALNRAMVEDWHMPVALGRVGRPEEIGELIAVLLSSRAAYVSGALINADGGTQF